MKLFYLVREILELLMRKFCEIGLLLNVEDEGIKLKMNDMKRYLFEYFVLWIKKWEYLFY